MRCATCSATSRPPSTASGTTATSTVRTTNSRPPNFRHSSLHHRHACEGRIPEGRGPGRATQPPMPADSSRLTVTVGAIREWPVPRQREPPRFTHHPDTAPFPSRPAPRYPPPMTTDAHTVRTDGQARNESPTGREGLVSTICKNSLVAEPPHISYDALPKTSFQQLTRGPETSPPPDGRDSFPPIYKNSLVAEPPHISYDALPKTSFQQLREARNESPTGREGLVSTIYKNAFVAEPPQNQLRRASKNEFPTATRGPKRVPHRTGRTRFHHLQEFSRS